MMTKIERARFHFPKTGFLSVSGVLVGALSLGCQQAPDVHSTPSSELAAAAKVAPAGNPNEKGGDAVSEAKAEEPARDVTAKQEQTPDKKAASESKSTDGEAKPAVDAAATLDVKRLRITRQVEGREPVEGSTLSTDGDPIYAFVEMANTADVDQQIEVTFEHETGKKVGFVTLKIPAGQKRWRTWGQTRNIRDAGKWSAVVSTEDGVELDRVTFDVERKEAESLEAQPGAKISEAESENAG